jgi:uncharacterized protein YegJ (DUF2314 family)
MLKLTQTYQPLAAAVILFAGIALPAHADDPLRSETRTNTANEPESYNVPNQHAAMRKAVTNAQKTVRQFIDALEQPAPGETDFEVKKPFVQRGKIEHIWLSDVKFLGGRFQGTVDNVPEEIKGLKLGQVVSVNPDEISDWMYIKSGRLVGGYTIRVHYNELTPEQKQEFDHSVDFRIE